MAKRITVECSKCDTPLSLQDRSFKRWMKRHGTDEYVCPTCINRIISQRQITTEERKERSKRAKSLWKDPKYRKKFEESHKEATSKDEFKKKASVTNKKRWADPEYRKRMEKNNRK